MSEQVDWWITTEFFANGGKKVMGPFASRDLALEVRVYREAFEQRADYFVDCEPAPTTTEVAAAGRESDG